MMFDGNSMDCHRLQESLRKLLEERGLDQHRVQDVMDSGYFLRDWIDPFSRKTWTTVSDLMYGNKQFSSSFPTDEFITYVNGKNTFPPVPEFVQHIARSKADIENILSDQRRAHYIKDGTLTFRGQTRQHTFKRKIPNPVRASSSGAEISVFPGIYRQNAATYSFATPIEEKRTLQFLLHKLEPGNPEVYLDSAYAYDVMRTEQHYATQTRGLDVAFDIDIAIFFATHRYERGDSNKARYVRVRSGDHTGVIYCFRFTNPTVKRTEFLVQDFDLFKTYRPERILRQQCGLPLIGDYERNIALPDIDCIIWLDKDFDCQDAHDPAHLFPPGSEDPFYARLLELKDQYPDELANIVEYEWARR